MTSVLDARAKRRVFAGLPVQVQYARDFTRRVLDGCPVAEDAVMLVSEIATNAITHTSSSVDGGIFTVIIWRSDYRIEIEIRDEGSVTSPVVRRDFDAAEESGYGLGLVDVLAVKWGHEGGPDGRVVWFEMEWA